MHGEAAACTEVCEDYTGNLQDTEAGGVADACVTRSQHRLTDTINYPYDLIII